VKSPERSRQKMARLVLENLEWSGTNRMCQSLIGVMALSLASFLVSIVSVVTGCTSLLTVPILVQFGLEPRRAIATNMLALTFLSLGGCFSFRGRGLVNREHLVPLAALTLAGSAIGALLLVGTPSRWLSTILLGVLVIAAPLVLLHGRTRSATVLPPSARLVFLGHLATFVLGIYGGFFSGGYVTLLSLAFLSFYRMAPLSVVATTKLANVISSAVASMIFLEQGLVDLPIAVLLGAVMFAGGFLGGRLAGRLKEIWLRALFIVGLAALAIKLALSGVY